jgi:hypothetical protein
MPYDVAPDPHGAWWYRYRDGTAWSRGPGERYDWWSPGPSQRALDAPWLLELRQQLEMRQDAMPNAHPIAIPPSQEDDANTRKRDTAVAEASGHQGTRVRIRTRGGSPGSADRPPIPYTSSSKPVPEFPPPPRPGRDPPGLGVEGLPPPPVRPAAELEPISITTDERYRDLMASNSFPDHPFTRWIGNGRPDPICWTLRDFEEYGERIGFGESTKSNYNVALKYFRMTAQDEFESRDMELPVAPISIRGIRRDAKGPQWTLSEGPPHAFVWVEMIAHLRSEDMALVVGPGIVSCVFKKDPIMYDHKCYQIMSEEKKREMKANGTVETTWDFVFRRVDGSECALHPNYSNNLITYREVRGPGGEQLRTIAPLVPKAGPGKSDGRGTFQRMIRQTEGKRLKWESVSFNI